MPAGRPAAPRRRRRLRFLLLVHGLTAAGYAATALAWGRLVGLGTATLLAVTVWLLTVARFRIFGKDRRRPLWVTRLVDEPLFFHWGASLVVAVGLLPGVLGLGALRLAPASWGLGTMTVPGVALCCYGVGLALAAWSVWGRRRLVQTREIDVPVEGLARAFDGYRIAHISDLHIGSFDRKERGLRWVARVNALCPDLVAVTGDLVTTGIQFYDDVAEVLAELRARDGTFVCLGNHDQWDSDALTRKIEARGVPVLRNASRWVGRGGAALLVAGLDDRFTRQADLTRTLSHRRQGVPTVLLCHYPDDFEAAAAEGADLVLSGHTHGGQIAVPFAADRWNLARLTRQRGRGLYAQGRSHLYVSAGLGTTGPPMRLGIAPEIAVLILRVASTPK